jgi:hypothetical protein
MTYPISQPVDNAAAYSWTQPIRDAIGGVNEGHRQYAVHAVGNSGTTLTLNASTDSGCVKTITLTGNCTFTLTGATSGIASVLELVLTQDATGSRTVTWPASVKWSGGAPTLSTAAGAVDRIVLVSYNGGTTWYGDLIGKAYA